MELKVEIPSYVNDPKSFPENYIEGLQFCLANIVANFAFTTIVHKFAIQFFW